MHKPLNYSRAGVSSVNYKQTQDRVSQSTMSHDLFLLEFIKTSTLVISQALVLKLSDSVTTWQKIKHLSRQVHIMSRFNCFQYLVLNNQNLQIKANNTIKWNTILPYYNVCNVIVITIPASFSNKKLFF